jgi:hypothetical protein
VIAWDCGDSFTYKIWTTLNDVWEDGCELIRSIVRSRSKEQDEPWAEYKNEDLEFTRTKLKERGQKNKEKRAKKRKHRSEDETEEDQQDPRRTVRLFDVSHQAQSTEPEEMGAEIPNLPQVNQPITAANGLLQPNPNPKTNSTDAIQATNPTISATRTREEEDATNLEDFDPSDDDGEIEMVEEVNADFFSINDSNSGIGGAHVTRLIRHNWFEGRLKFKVEWDSEQTTWEDLLDLKEDHPRMTASYILKENISRSKRSDRTQSWAKKVIRDLRR